MNGRKRLACRTGRRYNGAVEGIGAASVRFRGIMEVIGGLEGETAVAGAEGAAGLSGGSALRAGFTALGPKPEGFGRFAAG